MPFKDKEARNAYQRKMYKLKRKAIRAYQNKWRKENGVDKIYYDKNREIILQKKKEDFQKNRDVIIERKKGYYQKAKEKKLRKYYSQLKYERAHPERIKQYYQDNKEQLLKKQKARRSKKAEKTYI